MAEAYTYILECKDGSLYTGWTNDLTRRVKAHNEGRGAKYTRSHRPVRLVYFESFATKEEALARECADTVNAAVEAYLSTPPPTTAAMFDHLFATLPAALAAQRDEALRFAPRSAGGQPGGDHG